MRVFADSRTLVQLFTATFRLNKDFILSGVLFFVFRSVMGIHDLAGFQAIGANILAAWESQGAGVQWSNLYTRLDVTDEYTFGMALGMLVGDTLIYLILAW